MDMARPTRPISWIKAAQKDFETFPDEARLRVLHALTIAAEGGKADIAKPLKGVGSGVFEVAFAYRGNAYRVIYAVQLGADMWVVHAFQKKSKTGIKTPRQDIEIVRVRLRHLQEVLS